jgi:hypothetical protein
MPQFSEPFDGENEDSQLDRTHELAWALLDDHITADERAELEKLLLEDATARESYIRCAQLHAELASFFADPNPARGQTKLRTPVLGFLAKNFPQFNTPATDGTAK